MLELKTLILDANDLRKGVRPKACTSVFSEDANQKIDKNELVLFIDDQRRITVIKNRYGTTGNPFCAGWLGF